MILIWFDFDILRLISLIIILISKVCPVWFLKWHFWFPKFVAFDFSNDTFDFENLSRLISQMTLLIYKIYHVWFLQWHFWFPKFDAFWFLNWHFWCPKFVAFDFSNDTWFPKLDAFWFLNWHFWFPKLVAFSHEVFFFSFLWWWPDKLSWCKRRNCLAMGSGANFSTFQLY